MSCQVMYQSYYQSYFNSYHPNTSPPAAAPSATAENLALNSSGIAGNSGPSPPAAVLDLREAAASPHSPSASSSTKSVRFSKLYFDSRGLFEKFSKYLNVIWIICGEVRYAWHSNGLLICLLQEFWVEKLPLKNAWYPYDKAMIGTI